MNTSPTLAEAFDLFVHAQRSRKLQPSTLRAYRQDFELVAELIGDPDEITVDQLDKYVLREAFGEYADTGRLETGRSKATIERTQSTWRAFFRFLVEDEFVDASPMDAVNRPKVEARQPKPLKDWESTVPKLLNRLASGCRTGPTSWPELDVAVFSTLLAGGFRSAEFLSLDVGSFENERGKQIAHVIGKRGKPRTIPVEEELDDLLLPYLETRKGRYPNWKPKPEDPLFIRVERKPKGKDGGARMTYPQFYYLVHMCFKTAGIDNYRTRGTMAHALRHTYGTSLAASGVRVDVIRDLMGHSSVNTSQGYIDVSGRDKRDGSAKLPFYKTFAEIAALNDDLPEDAAP